jgi:hypothetical protein
LRQDTSCSCNAVFFGSTCLPISHPCLSPIDLLEPTVQEQEGRQRVQQHTARWCVTGEHRRPRASQEEHR